jgi:hypothetical protein
MRFPTCGRGSCIINVSIGIIHSRKKVFYYSLHNVRGTCGPHRETGLLVLSEWSDDCAEVLTCLVKFKGIVLHTNAKVCELVSDIFAKDIHDDRQRIMLLPDHFVKLS